MKSIVFAMKRMEVLSSLAARFVHWTGKKSYPVHPKHLVPRPLWFLPDLRKKDVLLDIGCDSGEIAMKASSFVKRIEAFDVNPRAIERAKKELHRKKMTNVHFRRNVHFFVHNAETPLPFQSQLFDVVLLLDVIEHVHHRGKLLREIHRIMKMDDRLFLTAPNSETSWKKLQRRAGLCSFSDPHHLVEYTEKEIRKALHQSGFVIEQMEPVVFDTWLAPLIDLVGGFSLRLYAALDSWKVRMVKRHPGETTGWRMVCRKEC